MEIYKVPRLTANKKFLQLMYWFLYMTIWMFIVSFALDWLWPIVPHGLNSSIIHSARFALFVGFFWSLFMSFLVWPFIHPREVVVTDKEITSVSSIQSRTVRKGLIRKISQRRNGVLISERSLFGLFMWGGVWIPKTLPEYEQLRALAESWRVTS